MKVTRETIQSGKRKVPGIVVEHGGYRIGITGRNARELARKVVTTYQADRKWFARLCRSIKSYKTFNNRDPKRLVNKRIVLDGPLIRIGKMPEITYLSSKEGSPAAYVHKTKRMPTLYYHPTKKIGVLLGGSIKVKDWLYD